YEIHDNSCEDPETPEYKLFILLIGSIIIGSGIFVGMVPIVSTIQSKKPRKGKRKLQSQLKFREGLTDIKAKTGIKTKPLIVNPEKVLQGKTLQVYWYILTHNRAGVREIQKSLKISSPGTVSYQIDKLLRAGIVSKNDKDGKYYVNEESKKGILGFYTRIGFLMIPRFSLYLIINVLGFIGYIIFASIYGDPFITNPGSILLLIFLIFGTAIFIFESIKIWRTRPSKQ
ncbi:MAG: winged helix-turn-helix domain-containing protein, partial [Promethearchaeota archaeon]